MKKNLFFCIVCLIVMLSMAGCSVLLPASENDILSEVAGETVHILLDEGSGGLSGTVETDNGTYRFQYGEDYEGLTITYPDGKIYRYENQQGIWDYPETETELGYLPGADLVLSLDLASGADAARAQTEQPSSGFSPILAVVIAALGLWFLISPQGVWRVFVESFRPEADPQPRTLVIFRIVGACVAVVGCLLLFL